MYNLSQDDPNVQIFLFFYFHFSIPSSSQRYDERDYTRKMESERCQKDIPFFDHLPFSCEIVLKKIGIFSSGLLFARAVYLHSILRETKEENDNRKKHSAAYCNIYMATHGGKSCETSEFLGRRG